MSKTNRSIEVRLESIERKIESIERRLDNANSSTNNNNGNINTELVHMMLSLVKTQLQQQQPHANAPMNTINTSTNGTIVNQQPQTQSVVEDNEPNLDAFSMNRRRTIV